MTDVGIDAGQFPITEVPGQRATDEQLSMFLTRYRFARDYCREKDVLEIACGGGQGLGYLAHSARRMVGGDLDFRVLPAVARRYRGRPNIAVRRFHAEHLPFIDQSFDIVMLLDAIYWLRDQEACLRETRRVLRPGGRLLITTVNCEWREFCPSPYATRYLNATDLTGLLAAEGFATELFAGFPTEPASAAATVRAFIRRIAITIGVMPTSIRGKERLKRVFFGKLAMIPAEVTDRMAPYDCPVAISPAAVGSQYKLLYAVCRPA